MRYLVLGAAMFVIGLILSLLTLTPWFGTATLITGLIFLSFGALFVVGTLVTAIATMVTEFVRALYP